METQVIETAVEVVTPVMKQVSKLDKLAGFVSNPVTLITAGAAVAIGSLAVYSWGQRKELKIAKERIAELQASIAMMELGDINKLVETVPTVAEVAEPSDAQIKE